MFLMVINCIREQLVGAFCQRVKLDELLQCEHERQHRQQQQRD